MPAATDYQIIVDAQQQQLELTFASSDSMDAKAIGILGATIALVIFALQSQMQNSWWLLIPMFACFVASVCCVAVVLVPRFYYGPGIKPSKQPDYLVLSALELSLQRLADLNNALLTNMRHNRLKQRWLLASFITAAAGVAFLIGCIL